MAREIRTPKITEKENILTTCLNYFFDDTDILTKRVLKNFYDALVFMETWDDVEPENNVSHDVVEKIRDRVNYIVFDYYTNRATYNRLDDTLDYLNKESWGSKRIMSNCKAVTVDYEKYVKQDPDLKTVIGYFYDQIDFREQILRVIHENGCYNSFMNAIIRLDYKYNTPFYTKRRSLLKYRTGRKTTLSYNMYAGEYQPSRSEKTIREQFIERVYDEKDKNGPYLAMGFPEYFSIDETPRTPIEFPRKIDFVSERKTSSTRIKVHIDYLEDGIKMTYEDGDVFELPTGTDDWSIGNEMRCWHLEKEDGKYYFRKYGSNDNLIDEVYIRKGDWLLATTSGACRNGMFHPVRPLPLKLYFQNRDDDEAYYDITEFSKTKPYGYINNCPMWMMDECEHSVMIKVDGRYFEVFITRMSECMMQKQIDEFDKCFANANWRSPDGKFVLYSDAIYFKD